VELYDLSRRLSASPPPEESCGHTLTLDRITHRFGSATAVREVSLGIEPGELVALLGPSGCGKSTLLRVIAGFITPSAGRVLIDGESIGHIPPNRRGVGIVFQNYALFPHMTVAANIAYGLDARGVRGETARARVAAMLALVQMESFAGRLPRQLSGGQQQRVALARALAVEPRILLLDEPFGALDKNLRLDMQIEIKRLQRDYGITTILVTHDQEEALAMADRIAVLNEGRVEQFAAPMAIYDRPASLFVSRFVGTTNLLSGVIATRDRDRVSVRLDCGATLSDLPAPAVANGGRVFVSVRPEQLRLEREPGPDRIAGRLHTAMPLGPVIVYDIEVANRTPVKLTATREAAAGFGALTPGAAVQIALATAEACAVFAENSPDPSLSPGDIG
jgi:putative spermidine/putrescine transport system ATP-binding protein